MRITISSLLVLTLVCPSSLTANDNFGPAPIVRKSQQVVLRNVELTEEGDLRGQLLNKSGQAIPQVDFTVEQTSKTQNVITGSDGKFTVANLKSGQCVFRVDGDVFACRVWKRGSAPPNALNSLALVASTDVVRGQIGIPLPMIPLPAIPLPAFPLPGIAGGLGGGSLLGVTLLAVGGAVIAVSASNDKSADASL